MNLPPAPETWMRGRRWGRDVRHLAAGEMHRVLANQTAARLLAATDPSQPGRDPISTLVGIHVLEEIADRYARDNGVDRRAPSVRTYMGGRESGRIVVECSGREKTMAEMAFAYVATGSQVFQMGATLTAELSRTDVDEVLCSDVQSPYRTFYLQFEGLGGEEPEGAPLDGFMVMLLDDGARRGLRIVPMTSHLPDMTSPGSMFTGMDIALENPDRPIAKEITDRIARRDFNLAPCDEDPEIDSERLLELGRRATRRLSVDMDGWLRLVINALLYIDTCGQTGERTWPQGAPADLVAKVVGGGPGARKAEQRLAAQGYTRLFRHEIAHDHERGDGAARSPRTHWRRGHWRRQPHGPGGSLRKLSRVRPTLVNATRGEPAETRVYKMPDRS